MKKSLLFAAALTLALSANAQVVARNHDVATKANVQPTQQMKNAAIEKRTAERFEGTAAQRVKKAPPARAPYYLRPAGTMYVNWDKEGSGFIMPFVNTKPYDEVTWRNKSTMGGTPSWGYWIYDTVLGARDSLVSNDYDLTVTYGYEYEDVPALMMGNVGPYELSGYRVNRTTHAIESSAVSGVASVVDSYEIYEEAESNFLASAHYYGSSNRFGTEDYGWVYYSGAPGPDYNPDLPSTDPAQDRSGYWFGKNYGGWNVFGCGFEKPISPYVLNKVYMWVTDLTVTASVDLTAYVYRLPDGLPAYCDTAAVVDPALLNEENLLATGRTTITTDMNEDGSPILEFTLYEMDPELGIEYETTPQVDDAIIIMIVGMDDPNIQSISALVTTDEEDDGVGEVTYMGHQEDGVITRVEGINNFFTSGELMVGSSILLDVTRPFMVFNYDFEEGEYVFPDEGGILAYNFQDGTVIEGVEVFTLSPSADWMVTTVNGGEVPSWLTIELEDQEVAGEWDNIVVIHAAAEALPDGVEGREAYVRFATNGAYIDYHFVQGEPSQLIPGDVDGNGKVEIDDMSIIIDIMLHTKTIEDYPAADQNGDGNVNIDDMNTVINILLHRE